ncbi:hypothetical protein HK102_002496 [Quaeritorhiza haematococci]|nr:hypothetical protein HK102_002496 [Quaeritorhiza haematococci]
MYRCPVLEFLHLGILAQKGDPDVDGIVDFIRGPVGPNLIRLDVQWHIMEKFDKFKAVIENVAECCPRMQLIRVPMDVHFTEEGKTADLEDVHFTEEEETADLEDVHFTEEEETADLEDVHLTEEGKTADLKLPEELMVKLRKGCKKVKVLADAGFDFAIPGDDFAVEFSTKNGDYLDLYFTL